MIDQPVETPICCGQPAKWVVISGNLAYHYCEKCKNEVVADSKGLPPEGAKYLPGGAYVWAKSKQFDVPNIVYRPDILPGGPDASDSNKVGVGDRVFFHDYPGIIFEVMASYMHEVWWIQDPRDGFTVIALESKLTKVP